MDDYAGKRVLITGASGFLGRHLAQRLNGIAAVLGISRGGIDLRDADQTLQTFARQRPEIVFHLASASGGSADVDNVLPHLQDDIVTTANCLVAAHHVGVQRFIVPGSMEESWPPDSPYALAKTVCVNYARMFHELYGTPTTVCRLFMTYGPQQKHRKIVPYIIRSMLAGRTPVLKSPQRLVDWIYVEDAVDALLLAGVKPGVDGQTIEIGSGQVWTVADMAALVSGLIAGDQPSCQEPRAQFGARRADLTAAGELLGWQPRVGLAEGLRATIDWYRSTLDMTA